MIKKAYHILNKNNTKLIELLQKRAKKCSTKWTLARIERKRQPRKVMLSIQANRYERFFILFWLSLLWYITIYRNIQTGLLFGLGPIWLWYLAHSQWKFSSFFDFLHSGAPQYTVIFSLVSFLDWLRLGFGIWHKVSRNFHRFWLSSLWDTTIYSNIQPGLLSGLAPISLWDLAHSQWKFSSVFDSLHSGTPKYTVIFSQVSFLDYPYLALGFGTQSVRIFIVFWLSSLWYTTIYSKIQPGLLSGLPRFSFGIWHTVGENFHCFLTFFTLVHHNIR